jgi:nucleoid DNA-binding protein
MDEMITMNKSELISVIAKSAGLTKADAGLALDALKEGVN